MSKTASKNEFDKIRIISKRLQYIFERDGVAKRFVGSEDYIVRAAVEALRLSEVFYDAGPKFEEITVFELYVKPKFPFDERFAHLCKINSGMSLAGAKRHYETLQHCPDGYVYYGKVDCTRVPSDTLVYHTAYDIDGELMPGYVVVFREM